MKITFLFLAIVIMVCPITLYSDWTPYDVFIAGPKGLSVGGAFVSRADDMGAFCFNPAGLFQLEKKVFTYEVYSIIKIQRLVNTELKLDWESLPLLAYSFPIIKKRMSGGFFIQTVFKSLLESYRVRVIGASYSWRFLKNISMGINLGLAIGRQEDNFSFGFYSQIGLLFRLSESVKSGLNIRFPISLHWDELNVDADVKETLPYSFQFGVSILVSKSSILSIELEYQGTKSIKYSSNGINGDPDLDTGLFKNIHPHIGFEFMHEKTGAQIRFGFLTLANSYISGVETQPVITFGIGAHAGKFLKIDLTLMDSIIFDIFTKTDRFERILLSFEYSF